MLSSALLSARGVSREFVINSDVKVRALKSVTLGIESGKLICLRGRSGSGKTTLINILGALDRPTEGEVWFGGREISGLPDKKRDSIRRYDMAFVFQSVALISTMTAFENVEWALRLAGAPISGRAARARECLTRVGLEKRMHHRPGELSGGEQQRVAIARAIAHKPKIILADEPTAELDSQTGMAVVKLFRELVSASADSETENLSIVMTTHDEAMMELADTVYHLEDGEVANVS